MTAFTYFAVILIFNLIILSESTYYTPIIQTLSGPVQGQYLTTVRRGNAYSSFKGIPYAEPPVGYLRFKPPVEKRSWTNVLDATFERNVCPQVDRNTSRVIGSEDCLSLNIYTPHTTFNNFYQQDLKAVLVWIYGGGFNTGSSTSNIYGPDFLLEDDVVVVSMNYRLGPFGFLNLNHANATGNAGLKDQNLALKWIKKNIVRFGGDPNRITIFGQSAGATAVDLHVLSDMSTGLFKQSISMSGSSLCLYWAMQSRVEAKLRAFTLGAKLGVTARNEDELLQVLYTASATDIASKAEEMPLLPFRPTIEIKSIARDEEKFLTECGVDKYRSGNYNKGPHMMGFTSVEAKSLAQTDLSNLKKNSRSRKSNGTSFLLDVQEMSDSKRSPRTGNALQELIITKASDTFFVTGIDYKQKQLQLHNKHPIYYYRFSFEPDSYLESPHSNNRKVPGVGHGEDVPYLFYIPFSRIPINNVDVQTTINRYVRLVTNFAKYGNPTPYGTADPLLKVTWPDSGTAGYHLEINKELSVGPRPIDSIVILQELAGLVTARLTNNCHENN